MIGNEQNQKLIEHLMAQYQEKGMDTFAFEWTGTRVPQIVTFPNGLEKTVQYMRDGLFLFTDSTSAVYERLADTFPEQPQSVFIAYNPSMHRKA